MSEALETVWVCCACGKRSHDNYGHIPISYGWDESCCLNAVEAKVSHIVLNDQGRVTEIKEGGIVEQPNE